MIESRRGGTHPEASNPPHHPHPPDWSSSDSVLEAEIEQEKRSIRITRMLVAFALALIALVVAVLVLSIVALNRDIASVATARPKAGGVGTSAIGSGAVTADQLASQSVVTAAIADAARVAGDSLTGKQIREGTLGSVPSSVRSDTAANATALGGLGATAFLSGVQVPSARVRARSRR